MSGMPLHCSVANGYRMLEALYPYNWEALDKAYHSGYSDGLHFLQTNDLVLPLLNTPSEPHSSPPDGRTDLETDWEEEREEENEWQEKQEEEEERIERRQEKMMREEQTKEEEEEEEEVEEWSSLTESRGNQRNYSLEGGDLPWNLATPELVMYLALPTWIHTALLCNIMGLLWTHTPLRVMSYLLLPFTLSLSFLLGNAHRLGVLGFWIWQDIRQITFFIINILVSSLHRNLEHRNTSDDDDAGGVRGSGRDPQGQVFRLHLSSISSSSPSPSSPTSSPDSNQYTVLLRLDLE
ncbi:uncharacterized protein LOC121568112 [Coregonus clupeaformis]|uniref:uncharacterized protein LOC121568112 n=1 Tax=Coregonus clupeaformis TaxID=59861 RepID=UPI001E1C9BF5|nr:uncharacterized protein LOC121568112 [Coregonus clupeaformis]